MNDVYERNINIRLYPINDKIVLVSASLLDLHHSISTEIKIDITTQEIIDADAKMVRVPYSACPKALINIRKIIGLKIEKGVNKKIADALGHSTGCTHLVEIIQNAMRFSASMLIGVRAGYGRVDKRKELTEEERIANVMPYLRNTCIVFKEG
jgi:hypothetical protein